jgi:hypothetical protein
MRALTLLSASDGIGAVISHRRHQFDSDTCGREHEQHPSRQRVPHPLSILGLQQSVGNQVVARMIAEQAVIQRVVVSPAVVPGLLANMDSSNLVGARAQIDLLWNSGKRTALQNLQRQLAKAGERENADVLVAHIQTYLDKRREADPMASNSSSADQRAFDRDNPPGDQTGIRQVPGQGEVLPAAPTPQQVAALAVRSWQIGDIVDGVSWSTLGHHLQGRMTPADYVRLGDGLLARRDLATGQNNQALATAPQKEQLARGCCQRVAQEIRVGLNSLPVTPGVSYRAATAGIDVYGTKIVPNDLIKDMSFWSTAALRASHTGMDFGSEGTLVAPKVYYIVTGSTGVFLPKYTNKETGVREILYKDQTIFHVDKITNYADRTFFVWITEVNPAGLPAGTVTKNPWSGEQNP